MRSSWPACTEPDPGDAAGKPFRAQAILANPVAYGHIHCAEALDVPLHLLFLQPWTPTVCFPHPFSNLPYSIKDSAVNRMSYFAVDGFFWTMVMKSHTATFREVSKKGKGGIRYFAVCDYLVIFVNACLPIVP